VPAIAHPHVWIDARLAVVFDEAGRLTAVREHWALDSNFTLIEVSPYVDGNQNGTLEPAEVDRAIAYYMAWINENHYFTRIMVDGTVVKFDNSKPAATFADGFFSVDAELHLVEPVAITESAAIDVFDREIYYDIDFPREGAAKPGSRATPDAPLVNDAIVAIDPPAGCRVGRRPPEMLDPMAVALLRRLGFSAPNDAAAGFPTRAVILCREVEASRSPP
jgi:ABC-type uncharacterized transport system substrate-binding protein